MATTLQNSTEFDPKALALPGNVIIPTEDFAHGVDLPRWVYALLAVLVAIVGLTSSAVTAKFFVMGLQRLESDDMARDVLIATGLLMIVTELMAFGLAALLPTRKLRALRAKLIVCGVMLLAFEATTIYITQIALMQTAGADATASTSRINNLITSISNRRAAAQSLRANGASQSASTHAWNRTQGAQALRDALKVEQEIDPLAAELARLQGAARPSMTTVLGDRGSLIYSVARAVLVSVMGLVMFGTAGALMRLAHGGRAVPAPIEPAKTSQPVGDYSKSWLGQAMPTLSYSAAMVLATPSTVPAAAVQAEQTPDKIASPIRVAGLNPANEPRVAVEPGPSTVSHRISGNDLKRLHGVSAVGKGWCSLKQKMPAMTGVGALLHNGKQAFGLNSV